MYIAPFETRLLDARRSGLRLAELDPESGVFQHHGGNQEAALALEKALAELLEEQREMRNHSQFR